MWAFVNFQIRNVSHPKILLFEILTLFHPSKRKLIINILVVLSNQHPLDVDKYYPLRNITGTHGELISYIILSMSKKKNVLGFANVRK